MEKLKREKQSVQNMVIKSSLCYTSQRRRSEVNNYHNTMMGYLHLHNSGGVK